MNELCTDLHTGGMQLKNSIEQMNTFFHLMVSGTVFAIQIIPHDVHQYVFLMHFTREELYRPKKSLNIYLRKLVDTPLPFYTPPCPV